MKSYVLQSVLRMCVEVDLSKPFEGKLKSKAPWMLVHGREWRTRPYMLYMQVLWSPNKGLRWAGEAEWGMGGVRF